jgi:hypothetical protein
MTDFEKEVLEQESQKPVDAPDGTWKGQTVGALQFRGPFDTKNGGKVMQAQISVVPEEPYDDVDADEAEEFTSASDANPVRFSKPIFQDENGKPSNRDLYSLDRILESIGFTGSRKEATQKGALNGFECKVQIEENDRGYKEATSLVAYNPDEE